SAPPHAITSSAIACTALSCCSCGLKVVKFSKSDHIESATCARTSAILISPITSLKFSTARTPPAPPYPTNPAALLFHSWKRKSIAFFNAAEVAWLYSGGRKCRRRARKSSRSTSSCAHCGTDALSVVQAHREE